MTDISPIAPIAISRFPIRRLRIPALGIGASLAAIAALLGGAFSMAYVDPYASHRQRLRIVTDDDLDGRDPNW